MELTDKQIKEFQKIYKKEFSEEISFEEARDGASRLVQLMKMIYKPIKKSDLEKLNREK
ncbi:hypothetical protein ACFL08_05725 [Patescibacteria group bacterium]